MWQPDQTEERWAAETRPTCEEQYGPVYQYRAGEGIPAKLAPECNLVISNIWFKWLGTTYEGTVIAHVGYGHCWWAVGAPLDFHWSNHHILASGEKIDEKQAKHLFAALWRKLSRQGYYYRD